MSHNPFRSSVIMETQNSSEQFALLNKFKLFWVSLKDIVSNHNFRLICFSVALLTATTNGFRIQAVRIIRPSLDPLSANKLAGKNITYDIT